MAFSVTKPTGGRVDDVRSLRWRFRRISFSGNYATGGETLLAQRDFGLKRIQAVIPLSALARAANGVSGVIPVFDIAADGSSVVLRSLEDAANAAGGVIGQEKNNAEGYVASTFIDVIVLGY